MANRYQQLVKAKAKYCQGKTSKAAVKKAAKLYVDHAVKVAEKKAAAGSKQKARITAKKTASKSANRVLRGGCAISSVIAGKKKKARKSRRK